MIKKALLVDTNFSAKPIYDFLIDSGLDVFVIGGNPDDALAKSANNYIQLDYKNIEELKKTIADLEIDYLIPGGNDFSYKVCAEISNGQSFYNIDSLDNYDIINNKKRFRKFSIEMGLNVPKFVNTENYFEFLPVIVKPADAYSGHGMTVIREKDNSQLEQAITKAKNFSKTGMYLLEQFVEGQLFSHSAFIVNGEIDVDFVVEEHCTVNSYVVNTSRVVGNFDDELLSRIRVDILKIVKGLNLKDGLMHTQFIAKDNNFWLIEITRRCPGDLYSKLIEYSTGFNYAAHYAMPFINSISKNKKTKVLSKVIRHTVTVEKPVSFSSIVFNYNFDKLKYIPLCLTGDKLRESPFSRIALLFGFSDTDEQHNANWNRLLEHNFYIIEE